MPGKRARGQGKRDEHREGALAAMMCHLESRDAQLARRLDVIEEQKGQAQPATPGQNVSLSVPVERHRKPEEEPRETFPPVPKRGRKQHSQE